MNKVVKQAFEDRFSKAILKADKKAIQDVKAGRVRPEEVVTKPSLPSLQGKRIRVYFKDSDAVSSAVDDFVDTLLRRVKNSHLIRDELEKQVYKGLGDLGEYVGVEIDLTSGRASVIKDF